MKNDTRPDVEVELARLKDFQRLTVDRVHQRLWLDDDYTKRFLVADEVGLGKTLVARGVIAKTIDHLWDTVDRIDIVYICSNAQIASQNLGRLNIGGYDVDHADRLTLLPTVISELKESKVNFVSFTPGTSFNISESGGKSEERVVLQHMLAKAWGSGVLTKAGWRKFFAGGKGLDSYVSELKGYRSSVIDQGLSERFAADLDRIEIDGRPMREVLEETVGEFTYLRDRPEYPLSRRRYSLIGRMRKLVAQAAVEALEPDLVILDEFQRFKDLMDPEMPGADLAHSIFDQETSRVLLLSATPYKMYTLPDEPEGDDHYADFLKTVEFLGGKQEAIDLGRDLRTMRDVLVSGGDVVVGQAARDRAQARLGRVMSRTERLAATPDRDGMLVEKTLPPVLPTGRDIRAYRSAQRIASELKAQDVFEYWRSSPYVFNLMDGYQVKERLKAALDKPSPELMQELGEAVGLLGWNDFSTYQDVDPGNAKLRSLAHDVLDRGSWNVTWLPPSLPYYSPAGAYSGPELAAFTKRLVFSSWNVVPKAISVMLSYEAERRGLAAGSIDRAYEQRPTALLRFQTEQRRHAGMPVLALLYPSVALARLGDPLALARAVGGSLPGDRDAVVEEARTRVTEALRRLPSGSSDGQPDQRWYWAVPFLLDALDSPDSQVGFMERMESWGDEDADDPQTQLVDHVREAKTIDASLLGRRPDDLVAVIADLALAGPGVSALRALTRVCGGGDRLWDIDVRDNAAFVSWGLRSVFNRPEIMTIVRHGDDDGLAYWRAVLGHCLDGNLQAVLDEYAHVLVESEGLQDKESVERAASLADVMEQAMGVRTTTATVDQILIDGSTTSLDTHRARLHFAMRFGRGTTEDDTAQREGQVRVAFNSPFWPFVLASTSVGQEGLDFHTYSHAVVHWNLPGNPVDLEQREGRVHRYKGHAVRRNVAANFADAALHASVDDPWYAMFLAASEQRPDGESELFPYWVYAPENGVKIERYVPANPLSKESAHYQRLTRTVGAYRMVIGQPRQEDLLRYANSDADLSWMEIDLSPPS